MLNYHSIFDKHVQGIRQEARYREFVPVKRLAGRFPVAWHKGLDREIVMWCINDYLGMSQHPEVLKAARTALEEYGVGSGGTRNIGGNNVAVVELEAELAALHSKEAGLVFTSGYVANDTTLATLAKIMPDIVFFSDEANHASIIAGIRNSKAEKHIYRHIDATHLEELLQSVDINRPKMIVFESAYSMDGLISPVGRIIELAKKYNAMTFIDEVHTVGLYGKGGAGIANQLGFEKDIDIVQGTLGKSYGTIGGYIAGRSALIDAIRLTASGFIFTTSLPPVIASAARVSVAHLRSSNVERQKHQQVVAKVKRSFEEARINYLRNDSHIIPIIVGDPIKVKQASEMLLQNHGIYVQHINFPTVPRGTERLRIIPTPNHTDQMIKELVSALRIVFDALGVNYQAVAA